jgi:Fe-S-cluster containining protein
MPKPVAVCASHDISSRISVDLRGRQVLCTHLTVMHKKGQNKINTCLLLIQFHHFPCPASNTTTPVRIQARIDLPRPLVCRKRPSDETGKTEAPCHSRCGTIKIPPCSRALSAKHRPKFCSPSPAMVTSPYKLSEIFLSGT